MNEYVQYVSDDVFSVYFLDGLKVTDRVSQKLDYEK